MTSRRQVRVEHMGDGPRPRDVLAAWPENALLAAMLSSGRAGGERSQSGDGWSVLTSPALTVRFDFVRGVSRTCIAGWADWFGRESVESLEPLPPFTHDPVADFESLLAWSDRACGATPNDAPEAAFAPSWMGHWSYELGGVIEPSAGWSGAGVARAESGRAGTLGVWHWSPAAFVFDHRLGEWTAVRSARCASGLPDWDDLRARASKPAQAGFMLEGVAPAVTPERYARIVERAVEYIRAGDAFQVNLAHPLRGRWSGSPRALFAAMHREAEPPYGAYIEDGDVSGPEERTIIASISPELFLRLDRAIGTVTTRPIKGTRSAIGGQAQAAAAGLLGSAKDAAELAMIVDLMRNDLGRVCRFGSVRVTEPRTLESHAGAGPAERSSLLHTAAEVAGRLGPGVGVGGLLRATYPAGSITGAPKIRAMQIIEELERGVGGLGPDLGFARGPYTGAIGLASTHRLVLSVAIRTAVLRGTGAFEFSAGAGIVADSDPASEWRETLDKAGLVLRLSGECRERASAAAQRLTPYGAAR